MADREQHGFQITVEVILPGTFDEAFKRALAIGDDIFGELTDEAWVVVRETDATVFAGPPNGVYCEGCVGHTIPGVRWPTAANGDPSRSWVERCDICQRYESDKAAAERVFAEYDGTGAKIARGTAKPAGSNSRTPYVEVN